ncbi:MAG: hypothetical protein IJA26_06615 [Clostridia bacterium]|nr:hypothetical protein [Clostridia bacterium]
MKKLIAILVLIAILAASACAESALEYALWLEEVLPDAAYQDAQIPDFVLENLSADYDIAARADAHYGSYIACTRKDSAPKLPDDIVCESYGSFETGKYRITDGKGKIYYDFILRNGVSMQAYDGARHIIITVDENPGAYNPYTSNGNMIYHAADPMRRSRLVFAGKKGFSMEGGNISVYIHSKESWQAGATKEPATFYMNVESPDALFGDRYLEGEMLSDYARIPLGIYYQNGETYYEFVVSEGGVYGLQGGEPRRLYSAGPGYGAVLDEIEAKLGYHPADRSYIGKTPVRACFEWQAGESRTEKNGGYEIHRWNSGAVSVEDRDKLKTLAKMIEKADFTIGSVNCPSPAFMTLEYADGSSASFAVAVNSFNLFFRNGVMFTTEGDIIDLFGIRETEFYKGFVGI